MDLRVLSYFFSPNKKNQNKHNKINIKQGTTTPVIPGGNRGGFSITDSADHDKNDGEKSKNKPVIIPDPITDSTDHDKNDGEAMIISDNWQKMEQKRNSFMNALNNPSQKSFEFNWKGMSTCQSYPQDWVLTPMQIHHPKLDINTYKDPSLPSVKSIRR